jgi:antitoxin component of MazEF toxin-antitoxin module
MQSTLIKIGNSQGVIVSAQLLKQCQLVDVVLLEVRDKSIVISKPNQPRSGWGKAFKASASFEGELLVGDSVVNNFDSDD